MEENNLCTPHLPPKLSFNALLFFSAKHKFFIFHFFQKNNRNQFLTEGLSCLIYNLLYLLHIDHLNSLKTFHRMHSDEWMHNVHWRSRIYRTLNIENIFLICILWKHFPLFEIIYSNIIYSDVHKIHVNCLWFIYMFRILERTTFPTVWLNKSILAEETIYSNGIAMVYTFRT